MHVLNMPGSAVTVVLVGAELARDRDRRGQEGADIVATMHMRIDKG